MDLGADPMSSSREDPFEEWCDRRSYEIVMFSLLPVAALSAYITLSHSGTLSTFSAYIFVGALVGLIWSSGRASVLSIDEAVTGRSR